jgi:asparagine synthase (glutamine-hydrolysing)
MSRLLGGIAVPGSLLDPIRLWRAAGSQQSRRARMQVTVQSTQHILTVRDGEEVPAECALLLPENGNTQSQDAIWVAMHGTLYNLPELAHLNGDMRKDESAEWQMDVVRKSYQRLGASCFANFRGSYACAILDLRNYKLLLARDHVGSKSLFYTICGGFYFASTIRALLEIRGSSPSPNRAILRDWLLDLPNGDSTQTFFDGIVQLPPATCLELNLSRPLSPSITEFWPINNLVEQRITREDAERRLRTLLADSIELSTRDAQTVGVMLSGGVDSSVVLATLRNCKGRAYPIHSFTFVSDTRASRTEESRARSVTELWGSEHHLVRYDHERIPCDMDDLLKNLEEPIASPVLFAHQELYRMARAVGVQTVLNGHGPDSLFAGSNSHLVILAAALCRRGRMLTACAMLRNAACGYRRLQLLKSVVGAALPNGFQTLLRRRATPEWLKDAWFQERHTEMGSGAGERSTNLRLQLVRELQSLSLPHTLRFEERASEACFIGGSSPFLAPELVEFALSLPEHLLIGRDAYTKSILRSASRDLLPKTILEGRDRMGFPIPAAQWLRLLEQWPPQELEHAKDIPFINATKVSELWELFQRSDGRSWQRAITIWRLIFLTRWAKMFRVEF